ncbi:MAG: recombination protein NinG [Polaromonas sp.]|nr:recombination protein NinG [Polaromonas sp.]
MKPKKCKVCKGEIKPPHQPMAKVCCRECAQSLAVSIRGKAEKVAAVRDRKIDKEKLDKLKTIAQLIAAAQIPFNAFIRLRDKDKGCFVCSRPFADVPGQVQHAGHVRSRGAAGHLRFNEDNCFGECEGCNGPHGAKPHQIKSGAIARIGQERFDALEADNDPHKWCRDELIAIKAEYMAKTKQLKVQS